MATHHDVIQTVNCCIGTRHPMLHNQQQWLHSVCNEILGGWNHASGKPCSR